MHPGALEFGVAPWKGPPAVQTDSRADLPGSGTIARRHTERWQPASCWNSAGSQSREGAEARELDEEALGSAQGPRPRVWGGAVSEAGSTRHCLKEYRIPQSEPIWRQGDVPETPVVCSD
eukprot:gene4231-biopygen5327